MSLSTFNEYVSDEARQRAEEAIAFYHSDTRKAWSSQRIPNEHAAMQESLEKGVEKLKIKGKQIVGSLLQDEDM